MKPNGLAATYTDDPEELALIATSDLLNVFLPHTGHHVTVVDL